MAFAISWRSSTERHGDFLKAVSRLLLGPVGFWVFVGVRVGCCFFVFLVLFGDTKVVVSHVFSLWE